ncbi:hypothetical protein L6164_007264 [Bauhinia variegata]|uniref:Uncharacterized protein n=1 Tax=Bauhinia variegata TaxID=167791 RepID=A0ACB9PD11_BAUVA|nr:hypothetical protein L6164_007264 [Bauhinia variegata]
MIYGSCNSISKTLKFGALIVGRPLNYQLKPSNKFSSRQIRVGSSHTPKLEVKMKEPRGALIVLEGLDRSGKSSQSSRLASYLKEKGYSAELWRFPDRTTDTGKMISAYLANTSQMDDRCIHLLFSANRWEKRSLMEAKLKTGTTLIVDRYSYSGVAFSSAKGLDFQWCKAPDIGLPAPDLVIFLDISPEEAARRGEYGVERYEKLDFQKKVAESYKALRDNSWMVVDASQSIDHVENELRDKVLECVLDCQKGNPISHLWLN